MSKSFKVDLTGQRFGRLTVLEFVECDKSRDSYWLCNCLCGKSIIVMASHLKRGATKSCGCLRSETVGKQNVEIHKTHGCTHTRLFRIWSGMKERCYNANSKIYKNYGARGIKICEEWKNDFKAFYDWAMANGYRDNLSIDRLDVNGNYEPSNCHWATKTEQARNRRNTVYVIYNGKKMCIAEVAKLVGINEATLYDRYDRGDRGDKLFRPVEKK